MRYLCYSFLFAGLYVYLGLGLTLLLAPESLKKYAVFLSPLVGYCYLAISGWFCFSIDLKGTDSFGFALLVPPAALLVYAIWNPVLRSHMKIGRELLIPVFIGIVGFLMISIPVITHPLGPTTLSIGNNDIAFTSILSRHLKEFSLSQPVTFIDATRFEYLLVFRFASLISTSFPSSLFSVEIYKLQSLSLNVFFSFGTALVYVACRRVFRYRPLPATGVAALYALSPIVYYTAYQGFAGQIAAMMLALGVLILHAEAIDSCLVLSDYLSYAPLAVLFNWGISATYMEMLPLFYLFVGCYVVSATVIAKSPKLMIKWAAFALATMAAVFLLSPRRVKPLLRFLVWTATSGAGWHMPVISPDMLLGLRLSLGAFQPYSSLGRYWPSVLVIVVIAAGLASVYRKDRRLLLFAGLSLLSVAGGYSVLAFQSRTGLGGYKSYKMVSFLLPQLLPCALILFRDLEAVSGKIASKLLSMLLLALLAGSLVTSFYTVKAVQTINRVVTKDQADLAGLESNRSIESINVLGSDWWRTMWAAHMLMRKQLYFEKGTYFQATRLDGEWNLCFVGQSGADLIHVKGSSDEALALNSSYVLERSPAALKARLGTGWHAPELSHRWTDSSVATIIVESRCEQLAVDLRAKYWPLHPDNHLSIYLRGRKLADCPDDRSCEVAGIVLSKGENVLEFRTALTPTLSGSGDDRNVSYAFNSIEVARTTSSGCEGQPSKKESSTSSTDRNPIASTRGQ